MRAPLPVPHLATAMVLLALAAGGSFLAGSRLAAVGSASGAEASASSTVIRAQHERGLQRAAYRALVLQLGPAKAARTPAGRALRLAIRRAG